MEEEEDLRRWREEIKTTKTTNPRDVQEELEDMESMDLTFFEMRRKGRRRGDEMVVKERRLEEEDGF